MFTPKGNPTNMCLNGARILYCEYISASRPPALPLLPMVVMVVMVVYPPSIPEPNKKLGDFNAALSLSFSLLLVTIVGLMLQMSLHPLAELKSCTFSLPHASSDFLHLHFCTTTHIRTRFPRNTRSRASATNSDQQAAAFLRQSGHGGRRPRQPHPSCRHPFVTTLAFVFPIHLHHSFNMLVIF